MGWIPVEFWHHLVSQNLKTFIFLLFSQYMGGPKKSMISPLLIYNKFRYHTHKIRLEKLVPLNYRFPTDNKTSSNKIDQTVFKLDFWPKSGFPKTRDLSPAAPPGGLYFQKWPHKNIFFWECQKTSKIVIVLQNGYLFYAFLLILSSPHPPPHPHSDSHPIRRKLYQRDPN